MKEYSYKEVKNVTKTGIIFKDGYELLFEECRNEWSIKNKININESYCVAERDSLEKVPYFLFYSKERVKVLFDKKGILSKKKNKDEFQNLQNILNRFGVFTYDIT